MSLPGIGLLAALQLLDDGGGVARLERAVVLLVDRDHRGDVAGAQALEALDEDLAVGRVGAVVLGLVVVAPGGLAELGEDVVGAAHPARDVVADEDAVLRGRLEAEEVVEARDGLEVGGGDAHHGGRLADPVRRAPAVVALDGPERRDRCGAKLRIAAHRLLDRALELGRHVDLVELGDALGVLRASSSRSARRARRSSGDRWGASARRCRSGPSSVDSSEHRVQHGQVLDHVGDVLADAHVPQRTGGSRRTGRGSGRERASPSRRRG